MSITICAQTPDDNRTLFSILVNDKVVAKDLTAVQAHIVIGDLLEKIALPRPADKADLN